LRNIFRDVSSPLVLSAARSCSYAQLAGCSRSSACHAIRIKYGSPGKIYRWLLRLRWPALAGSPWLWRWSFGVRLQNDFLSLSGSLPTYVAMSSS